MTRPADYFAFRNGAERPALDYPVLRRLACALFERLEGEGWFQASLGKDCPDAPVDVGAQVVLELGHELWPLSSSLSDADEAWLFTGIEFAYAHVAKPLAWRDHSWNGCGRHVKDWDYGLGRTEFQAEVKKLLDRYEPKYMLSDDGLIYELPPTEMAELQALQPSATGSPEVDDRVASATRAFLRYGATDHDKRHAIRDLADVFEHLRATVGTGLPRKDEGDLFAIANRFGIRHWNPSQKTDYQAGPWLDWIYYSFLNSIYLANRLRSGGARE